MIPYGEELCDGSEQTLKLYGVLADFRIRWYAHMPEGYEAVMNFVEWLWDKVDEGLKMGSPKARFPYSIKAQY